MNEYPPAHAALANAMRLVGNRLMQLGDSLEHGARACHMEPSTLLLLASDALSAARRLEGELVKVEGLARCLAPLGRVAERGEAPPT